MLQIFAYDFMVRAFAAGIVTAVIAPTIGIFLVTRRYAFMADALSHISLAGVAIGYLLGVEPIFTAFAASTVAAISVEKLRSSKQAIGETALALFLSGGLALASVLLSISKGVNINLGSILFGSITTVSAKDVTMISGLAVVVLLAIAAVYKELLAVSFDEELAATAGIRVRALNYLLVVLAALTVSLSMRTVGVLLVGALMVIPVVAAMQWRQGFFRTLMIAIALSLLSVILGLFVAYYADTATGGTIILIAIGFFLLSLLKSPWW